ncbi:MAG: alpha/beta hydrolase [Acidimicrobiia bacterium]|nr:alpha/beta hydrolase [Acidimicrobiia bacterium]
MPTFESGDVSLYYEEQGSGFPVLLIAPGGMQSSIGFWENTPWNPIEHLSGDYRVIAMDQRNAGKSSGPISGSDGWHTYRDDQLALLDHLGVDRFHVAGMCIGGPYIMGLVQAAPARVASGVVFQTIGLDDNREAFYEMFDNWAVDLRPSHAEVSEADWASFRENMYGGDEFLFNVGEDFVPTVQTPLLVLLGRDLYHPESSSRELARLAPNATLVEDWIPGEHHDAAKGAVAAFLGEHTP